VGWLLSLPVSLLVAQIADAPTAVACRFVFTFALWVLAEQLGLSAVVTVVVFGLVADNARSVRASAGPDVRRLGRGDHCAQHSDLHFDRPATRPILEPLRRAEFRHSLLASLVLLAVVLIVPLVAGKKSDTTRAGRR